VPNADVAASRIRVAAPAILRTSLAELDFKAALRLADLNLAEAACHELCRRKWPGGLEADRFRSTRLSHYAELPIPSMIASPRSHCQVL